MRCISSVALLLLGTFATLILADAPTGKPPVSSLDAQGWVIAILNPREGTDEVDAAAIRKLEALRKVTEQTEAQKALAWLDRNRLAVANLRVPNLPDTRNKGLFLTLKNGKGTEPTILYLHALQHHASGKLIAYGVSGKNLKRAYWLGEPKKDLKVQDTGRDLIIEVTPKNGPAPDPVATVIALEFDGEPVPVPVVARPGDDGTVLLHSKDAFVIGTQLRYEPEPNKNTLGYWSNQADWCRWKIELPKESLFDVELLQGCGKGSGGSEVEIAIMGLAANDDAAGSGDHFTMIVQDTVHFQNFIPRTVGQTKIGPGTYWVVVKPKTKKGVAVMDLRQVTLKPVKE